MRTTVGDMDELSVELPDSVRVIEGLDGLPALQVDGPASSGVVQMHGTHVTSFVPASGTEMLWLSELAQAGPGRAIRGGVPICFPWFGSGRSGELKPSHGPARLAPWRLVGIEDAGEAITLQFELSADDITGVAGGSNWPSGLVATYTVRFSHALELQLTAHNGSDAEVTCEAALHTYLVVDDVRDVAVLGADGATVLDQLTGSTFEQQGPIVFDGEVDVIVHAPDAPLQLTRREPAPGGAFVELTRTGSTDVVVWNPHIAKAAAMSDVPDDAWTDFVCLETAYVREGAVTLAPGESHVLSARYAPGE